MNCTQRILLVDDHTLVRDALRALLTGNPDIEIVAEADNGREAIVAVGQHAPQLVLMDMDMPGMNGIEATVEIKRRYPGVRVLMVTAHRDESYVHASLSAGADGYILKNASQDEFHVAIRSVLRGKTYLSIDVSDKVVSGFLAGGKSTNAGSVHESLTPREREVLQLVADGHSNKSIAEAIQLSVKTVEKHRSQLMAKLGLHNASALTAYAIKQGLTSQSFQPKAGHI